MQIDPKNAQLHKALAMELKDAGDNNGAIAELLTCRQMLPTDYEVKLALQTLSPSKHKSN